MTNKTGKPSIEVTALLDGLNHPFRNEIECIRGFILSANASLTENVKWNGPNYCFENEDRITLRVQPVMKQVQIIFHRGTKKREQPAGKLIANTHKLLVWKENDRAVMTFKSMKDIENAKNELAAIVNEWLAVKYE